MNEVLHPRDGSLINLKEGDKEVKIKRVECVVHAEGPEERNMYQRSK